MTDTNRILLSNLTRNAPWLIEGRTDLFPEALQEPVSELIRGIRDNPLTIISDGGQIYEQYQCLEIANGEIKIEKPSGWEDSTGSFHVFFKNKNNLWNFFLAQNTNCYPSEIIIGPPEKIFFLQRRRYKRVHAPNGTRATFKGPDNHIDSAHVKDISEGGMQICISSTKDKFPSGSIINEIFITTPPMRRRNQEHITRWTIPLVNSGKVVRSFYDQDHYVSRYGISFSCDSTYVKENIRRMLTTL
jgi:hypothetical protein